MAKFVKGEIVCSTFNPSFIGVFDRLEYNNIGKVLRNGHKVSCFITAENVFKFREGSFGGFQKTTKKQKEHFKNILLKHGYSYYKGKIIEEL